VPDDELTFRPAGPGDADAVALLHADSWRRHYRGAYSDLYLDGDVVADRKTVWSARLAAPASAATILAEDETGLAGFVHVVFDDDEKWGSLVDNLHVVADRHRTGIGRRLMCRAGSAVVEHATGNAVYLWVQEQNVRAQAFYRALGGIQVEKAAIEPPRGKPEWLVGAPNKFRIAWPDAAALVG